MNLNQNDRFGASGQPMPGTGFEAGRLAEINEGLRKHMLRIYNLMAIALVVTGLVAMVVGNSETAIATIFGSPLKWVVMFAPLGFVLVMGAAFNRLSVGALGSMFFAYAAVMGVSMSAIVYMVSKGTMDPMDVTRAFLITAGTFGGMSLIGYTTKKDMSGMRGFFLFAVIGLIVASLVNFFLVQSGMFAMILSAITILVFAGLIAYYTQEAKQQYLMGFDSTTTSKLALMSALGLYIAVVAIFQNLLALFSSGD